MPDLTDFINSNDNIPEMFSYDGAHSFSFLFGSPRAFTAQPRVLMRWWMGAYGVMEALDPPVAANLRGDSSNVGLHSDAPS